MANAQPRKGTKKASNPDVDTYLHQLTEEEVAERAKHMADLHLKIEEAIEERRSSANKINERLKKLRREMDGLANAVSTGKERRPKQIELVTEG